MGFRIRKSIRIMPGVRMNLTKTGIGMSMGVRGARMSVNTHGRVTRSLGIPGSGLGYVQTTNINSHGRSQRPSARQQPAQQLNAAEPPPTRTSQRPSLFAPSFEKSVFKFLEGKSSLSDLQAIDGQSVAQRHTVLFVEAVHVSLPERDNERTRQIFDVLSSENYDPATDVIVNKYVRNTFIGVPIADGVSVEIPMFEKTTIALMLAELEQASGDIRRAIAVVEALEPTTIAAVSLADLYLATSEWQAIVDLTNEITNADDPSVYLLIQRGVALRELTFSDAAHEPFTEALRFRSRSADLRHLALIERGKTYLTAGQKALARKDFEKVLAEDSTYSGLTDLLHSAT